MEINRRVIKENAGLPEVSLFCSEVCFPEEHERDCFESTAGKNTDICVGGEFDNFLPSDGSEH